MIFIYSSEAADWCSTSSPTAEQLRDPNLRIWRVGPDVIEWLDHCPPSGGHSWYSVRHSGGYYRYIYIGLWGAATAYSTTWHPWLAEADDGQRYEVIRITSKPGPTYEYIAEWWSTEEPGWYPMEQR